MKELKVVRFKAEGVLLELKGSNSGEACLSVILEGESRTKRIRYEIALTLKRCSYHCILSALQKFAETEKRSVDEMARRLGVS